MKRLLPIFLSFLLFSPGFSKNAKPSKDTINFLAFNDFHGSFQAAGNVPGAGRLTASLLDLRASLPNVMVLAGGDNYSGGYFPRMTGGLPQNTVFDRCGVEYSAIGNHEFDWGIEAMQERLRWGNTRYIAANIFTDSLSGQRPEWAVPYVIEHRALKNGTQVRIALIGLTSCETKTAALPSIVAHLDFANPVATTRKIMQSLQDSADLYILLTHIGTAMRNDSVVFTDEGVDGLSRIKGVDGILSGHSHKSVYGLKDGIPVIQAQNYGRKIARLQYEVSRDKKGRLSHRFLSGELIETGHSTDTEIEALVESFLSNPTYGFSRILTQNLQELDPETQLEGTGLFRLGALVTQSYADSYRHGTKADSTEIILGVCNAGSIRTILPQGEITQLQAGNIVPFGGVLEAFRINGSRLRALFQYGIECKAGWMQYHNMEVTIENGKITDMVYVRNGKRTPIEDNTPCTIITEHFMSSGGDGYPTELFAPLETEFSKIPAAQRNPTDVFIHYLESQPQIDLNDIAMPTIIWK